MGHPRKPTTPFKTARVEVPLRVPVMAAFLGDMRTGVDTPTTQGWKQKVGNTKGEKRPTGHMFSCAGTVLESSDGMFESEL